MSYFEVFVVCCTVVKCMTVITLGVVGSYCISILFSCFKEQLTIYKNRKDENENKWTDKVSEEIEQLRYIIEKRLDVKVELSSGNPQLALINVIHYASCIYNMWNADSQTSCLQTDEKRLRDYLCEIKHNIALFVSQTGTNTDAFKQLRIEIEKLVERIVERQKAETKTEQNPGDNDCLEKMRKAILAVTKLHKELYGKDFPLYLKD